MTCHFRHFSIFSLFTSQVLSVFSDAVKSRLSDSHQLERAGLTHAAERLKQQLDSVMSFGIQDDPTILEVAARDFAMSLAHIYTGLSVHISMYCEGHLMCKYCFVSYRFPTVGACCIFQFTSTRQSCSSKVNIPLYSIANLHCTETLW